MTDYRSPATTTNHYAKDDPSAAVVHSDNVKVATGHVATLGRPADGVVINEDLHAHPTHHETVARPTAATTTTTTATQPQPMAGQAVHTLPSGANADGLVVNSNLGGPLGGTVVLGGQCECLRNGGTCGHGAGQCSCRGCTTAATSLNPGINIGVSTHQYTAPVGTTGIGGGVADRGTGMAGVVNPTNPVGQPVSAALQNCGCVQKGGVCKCAPGQCACTNCAAHRKSTTATQASHTTTAGAVPVATTHHTHHHTHHPHGTHSHTTTTATSAGQAPYAASDYTEGKPVNNNTVI